MQQIPQSEIDKKHPVSIFAEHYAEMSRNVHPRAPLWSNFDPTMVPSVLAWLIVVERQNPTPDGHIIRLMGEGAKELAAANFTNFTVETDFPREDMANRLENFNAVAQTRKPSFHRTTVPIKERNFIDVLRGCFPFCDETGEIIRLIVVVAPISHHP